ncbi:MAG: aminopeptidase P family protein [Candidatus Aenigmarchaeota archaeon]|nr:aminopeptidase P family protein [Candidatus Aenigmarchaeota archaeon]
MKAIAAKKQRELRTQLEKQGIGSAAFMCTEALFDPNVSYFSGLNLQRNSSFAFLIITPKKSLLAVSALEYEQAQKEANVSEIVNLDRISALDKLIKDALPKGRPVGVSGRNLSYSASKLLSGRRLKEISGICSKIRAVKEPQEIELIKKACRLADRGAKCLAETLSPNQTEREIALGIENEMRRLGADEIAFPTIVTSGRRSSLIHPSPSFSGRKLGRGLGLADFGARVSGYCSDITVPFSIGRLSLREEKIARTVEKAYDLSVKAASVGVPAWKLHQTAENFIKGEGFNLEYLIGHGIGLETHDAPVISPKPLKIPKGWSETKLAPGMAFTIEPGIHVPGVGGWRLENDFLVTTDGVKRLTNATPVRR